MSAIPKLPKEPSTPASVRHYKAVTEAQAELLDKFRLALSIPLRESLLALSDCKAEHNKLLLDIEEARKP